MRVRVFREGVETNDGRLMDEGVLTWRDEPMPVSALAPEKSESGHEGARLVGHLDAVQREAGGWVTADLDVPGVDLSGYVAEADLDHVEVDKERSTDDLYVFKEGRLRGVTLGDRPCWEGMVIE